MLEHVREIGSTNTELLSDGRDGAPEGRVLITDHQTAGRGRQGRAWVEQPETSLLMSVLLRPEASWAPLIPLAVGLAVVEAVAEIEPGVDVGLKWPNDVLVRGAGGERKLAGILAEAATIGDDLVVVVGWGMNLRPSEAWPADVAAKAVALSSLVSAEVDRFDLARRILHHLEAVLRHLEAGRAPEVLDRYRERCVTLGRDLRLQTPGGSVTGRAVAVGADGALHLETADGVVALTAGEAHHL